MSVNENDLPIDEATEQTGLSIDQPVRNLSTFPQPEYDGAEPSAASEEPAPPAPKKLLRVDMGNGKYYTAESERELLQKLVDGKKEADRYIEELKSKVSAPPAPAPSVTLNPKAPVYAGDLPDGYDHQTYLNLLAENPKKAAIYMNRELYGDLEPVQTLNYVNTVAKQVQQSMIGADFVRRNPDFVPTPENAEILVNELKTHGISDPTIKDMEWHFQELKRAGKITAPSLSPDGEYEYEDITFGSNEEPKPSAPVVPMPQRSAPPAPVRRGANAPPSMRGPSRGAVSDEPADAYSMPLDELRKKIESAASNLRRR